jgi:hypothetical protein
MTIGPSSAAYTAASSHRSSFPQRITNPLGSISFAMSASKDAFAVAQHCLSEKKTRQ